MGNSYAINPNMNGFNFGWNTNFSMPFLGGWGNNPSSSSSSSKSEYELELEKELKSGELLLKNQDKIKQYEEALQAKIDFTGQMSETLEKAEKGKVDEATGQIMIKESKEDFKKLSKWQKIKRFICNAGEGALQAGMDLLGIESVIPPKINWKKLGTAALVAGGVFAATLIPGVGPFVVPAMLTLGLASGGAKIVKGGINACKTDDPEEFDNASKNFGEGAMIFGLSAVGIKKFAGMPKVFSGKDPLPSGSKAFINIFKGTGKMWTNGLETAKASIHTSKRYVLSQLNSARKLISPKNKGRKFNCEFNKFQNGLEDRITQIDTKLADTSITQAEKAILQQEKVLLERQCNQFSGSIKKEDWSRIGKESSLKNGTMKLKDLSKELQNGGEIELTDASGNIVKIQANERQNRALLNELIERNNKLSKEIKALAKSRQKSMKWMSLSKDNKTRTSVEEYTGKSSRIEQVYSAFKPATNFTKKSLITVPFKTAKYLFWDLSMKPFIYGQKAIEKGYAPVYIGEKTIMPKFESEGMITALGSMISGLTGAQLLTYMGGSKALTTTVTQKDENGEEVTQEVAVTQETLAELENQKKAAEQEIDQIRNEIAKLSNPDVCIA